MFVSELSFQALTRKRAVKAFIFDLDGTIIDSRDGIVETVYSFLKAKGVTSRKDEIAALFGTPIEDLLQKFMPMEPKEKITTLVNEIRQIYAQNHLQLVKLFPGTRGLLQSLKKAGFKVGLASTKFKPFILEALEHFNLTTFFDVIVSGYEVKKHKPAPDLLLYAAKLLDITPEDCVYIGDSKTDVLAGKAAKMATILVSTNNYPEELIVELNPDFVIPTIAAICFPAQKE